METKTAGPSTVQALTVDSDHAGQRIDNYLMSRLKGVPRSLVYRLLRTGQVRVNKGRIKPGYRLKEGDTVRIPPVHSRPVDDVVTATPEQARLVRDSILYEDAGVIAVNKPAGLPVHGGSGLRSGLVDLLRATRDDLPFIELVHRLDRYTSGCLLFAKDRATLQELHRQFRTGRVVKRYLALVRGSWAAGMRMVDAPLGAARLVSGERRIHTAAGGKPSTTQFVPRTVYTGASLVEAQPRTGRTHQIRVHAAHVGHPIAGDAKYGDRTFNQTMRRYGLRRLFLHAHYLEFTDPGGGRTVTIHAPLPQELQQVLHACAGHEASL